LHNKTEILIMYCHCSFIIYRVQHRRTNSQCWILQHCLQAMRTSMEEGWCQAAFSMERLFIR